MPQKKAQVLPYFGSSLSFGEPGIVAPFYVEGGIAKSGYFVHGDWVERTLLPEDLAKVTQQGFPLKGVSIFRINTMESSGHVHLVFLENIDLETLTFWKALTFVCTGNFFNKYHFLKGSNPSSLSGKDLDTIQLLQSFFSYETTYGEEMYNILFDTDRKVLIVRGVVDDGVLDGRLSFPDTHENQSDLQRVTKSFLE